jgi:hypothetical protein
MPEQRLVAFYLTTRRCREVDLDQATGSCPAYIKVPVTEHKMLLQAPLDSVSVWSHLAALRTLPQRQAIAERRSGSELRLTAKTVSCFASVIPSMRL